MAEINLIKQHRETSIAKDGETFNESVVLQRQIEPIIKEFNQVVKEVNATLSVMGVHEYIENFLALHLGFQEEDIPYTIQDWIDFAGSPSKDVRLVDREGNEVAIVPSVYPTSDCYKVVGDNEVSAETLEMSLGEKMQVIRNVADNYRAQAKHQREMLDDDLLNRFSKQHLEAHRLRWREFFKKMGLGEILEGKNNQRLTEILSNKYPDHHVNEDSENIGGLFISEYD